MEAGLAGKTSRVAELEADRAEIEAIRMREMEMVMQLREEIEANRTQLTEVRQHPASFTSKALLKTI
jgi:hypothetical protein